MAKTELDYMEYTSNALARAAYVTSQEFPASLLLWSRMGAAGEITSPEVGEAGSITGGAYVACKFDNGFEIDANSEYIRFDNSDVPTTKGRIEFWYKPYYDKDDSSYHTLFRIDAAPHYIALRFDHNTDKLDFYIVGDGGTAQCLWEPTWSANDLVHIAVVWDKDAGFDGAKTIAIYVNNVQVASDTSAFGTPAWGANDLYVGNRAGNDRDADGIIDNFKIWDDTATDFSDKDSEDSYNFQCYSESSVKQQGSYSLKITAKQTESLNDTLTRTVSPTIDLSGQTKIKLDVRASRTGSNFKIGFHDSGGTTTEHTVNIASADTWQTEEWDISGVANADKDAIDSIIITILNADAENEIYVDNMYATVEGRSFGIIIG